MCLKNWIPRPFPSEAPLINPGKSATVKEWSWYLTKPNWGTNVVNSYSAILALAFDIALSNVLLPAL